VSALDERRRSTGRQLWARSGKPALLDTQGRGTRQILDFRSFGKSERILDVDAEIAGAQLWNRPELRHAAPFFPWCLVLMLIDAAACGN
jgi:hypothetical protein